MEYLKLWWVYIIRCGDGTLYTGISIDVEARLKRHIAGTGARYTRGRGPLVLVFKKEIGSQQDAMKREREIKKMSREGKEAIVESIKGES